MNKQEFINEIEKYGEIDVGKLVVVGVLEQWFYNKTLNFLKWMKGDSYLIQINDISVKNPPTMVVDIIFFDYTTGKYVEELDTASLLMRINELPFAVVLPATVSVTATSAIPLWIWDEDGIATIPCTRANPVKVGMPFGIAVSEEGESNKTTIVTPHVDTPESQTIHFNIKLSDPLTPVLLRGTYIGNVIINGGAGTIHVNLTSFTPERKTVTFNSVPAGATVAVD